MFLMLGKWGLIPTLNFVDVLLNNIVEHFVEWFQ